MCVGRESSSPAGGLPRSMWYHPPRSRLQPWIWRAPPSECRRFHLRYPKVQPLYRPSESDAPGIKRIERAFGCAVADAQEFPRRRKHGGSATQYHRRQIDPVAIFIHEALRGAVVDGCRARVQRKVGILVGAGRGDLRENRLLEQKIPARAHDRLREAGYQISAELLLRNQV